MLDTHMPAQHSQPMVEVVGTDEFAEWFDALDERDQDDVARAVDTLESVGIALPFPYSSAI